MNNRFDDAKVGDKVYDRVYGFGVVEVVRDYSDIGCPLGINFNKHIGTHAYTRQGKPYLHSEEATLFYVDGDNKYAEKRPIPKVPWDKVPVDTKISIEVSSGVLKRYYAGRGRYFGNGATSWSVDDSTNDYPVLDDTSLAEEITIDGVVYPIGSK